ncbi:hypothetical protein HDU78_000088 [Chytriomyces hyalinus]|nr:hypothetical protein HDU78_000088 [Chytriomyces hyalinus]
MSDNPHITNLSIGLINWYCWIPSLDIEGTFVRTPNISAGLFSYNDIQNGNYDAWLYFVDMGLQAAIDSLNNDSSVLSGIHINIKRFSNCGPWRAGIADSWTGSTGGVASVMAQDIIENHKDVIGVIGMEYSSTTRGSASVLSIGEIPYCTGFAGSLRLSDKNNYPYLWRTVTNAGVGNRVYRILEYWHVSRVVIVYERYHEMSRLSYLDVLKNIQQNGILVLESFGLAKSPSNTTYDHIAASMQKCSARYVVVLGSSDFTAAFLNAMGVRNMVDDDHVYLGINGPSPSQNATLLYGDKYFGYIKGYIQFSEFNSVRDANYYKALNEVNQKMGINATEFDIDSNNIFYYYDCVKAMAYGMDSFLKAGLSPEMLATRQLNPQMSYKHFRNTGYSGILRDPFTLDENGDFHPQTLYYSFYGDYYNGNIFAELEAGGERFSNYNTSAQIFFNGGSVPPVDGPSVLPTLTYSSSNMEGILLIAFIVIGIAFALISGGAIFVFRVHSAIRSSSPPEMLVLCGGCSIMFASLIGFVGTPDALLCTVRTSGIFIGFILFATPLICKTLKMLAIVTASHRMKDAEAQQIVFKSRLASAAIISAAVMNESPQFKYMRCTERKTSAISYALYMVASMLVAGIAAASGLSAGIENAKYNESTMLAMVVIAILSGVCLTQAISASANERTDFFIAFIVWTMTCSMLFMVVSPRLCALLNDIQVDRYSAYSSVEISRSSAKGSSSSNPVRATVAKPKACPVHEYYYADLSKGIQKKLIAFRIRKNLMGAFSKVWWWSSWKLGRVSVHALDNGKRRWIQLEAEGFAHCCSISSSKWIATGRDNTACVASNCTKDLETQSIMFEFETHQDAETVLADIRQLLEQ